MQVTQIHTHLQSTQKGSKQIISTRERYQIAFSENISSAFTDSQTPHKKLGSIWIGLRTRTFMQMSNPFKNLT